MIRQRGRISFELRCLGLRLKGAHSGDHSSSLRLMLKLDDSFGTPSHDYTNDHLPPRVSCAYSHYRLVFRFECHM